MHNGDEEKRLIMKDVFRLTVWDIEVELVSFGSQLHRYHSLITPKTILI